MTSHGLNDRCLKCGKNNLIQKNILGEECWVRKDTWDENIFKEMGLYLKKISLTPEDVWLDVGGNIGSFCKKIAKEVATVIAYEPDENNFELLKKNNEESDNIIFVNKAVIGNADIVRDFYLNQKTNKSTHSFFVKRGRERVEVGCENVNEIIQKYKVDKIKIDCEGSEYEIIKSIVDFSSIKEIFVEFHLNILCKKNDLTKYREVIKILKKNFAYLEYPEDVKKNWHVYIYVKK